MSSSVTTSRRRVADSSRGTSQRTRRRQVTTPAELRRSGQPVRAAMVRVPLVIALIIVLAAGVGGILYLNTKTDELGMRTEAARAASAQLRLEIESLNRTVAELSATPRIAHEAQELGLVPAGDAPIIIVAPDGSVTLVGVDDDTADDAE